MASLLRVIALAIVAAGVWGGVESAGLAAKPGSITRWAGRWDSPSQGHTGTVRMRLRQIDANHYQGLFAGRFAVVIPYVYRAPVTRVGNTYYSEKRLGPLGSYRMTLQSGYAGLSGSWSAGSSSGPIYLQPVGH